MNNIAENLKVVREQIDCAAEKSGRTGANISLVAVTKMVESEQINRAIKAGVSMIGENRVQEFREKSEFILPVQKHLIGHLQTNKVKYAVNLFDLIQSVDSFHLAEEINKRCKNKQMKMPILVEVNTSGESSKFGCDPAEAVSLISRIANFDSIRVKGLMTIGPLTSDEKLIRKAFRTLKELAEKIQEQKYSNVRMKFLSMGMSADYQIAIEEGSNMVRIGTAIFGPRACSI